MLSATLRMPAVRLPRLGREHWAGSTVLAVAAGLYLVAGISVTSLAGPDGAANAKAVTTLQKGGPAQALPATGPTKFKQVAPEDAVSINAAVPIADLPNPAARAFLLSAGGDTYSRSLSCLTAAIYYEAATESVEGQRAVAQVVLNRLRHPAYPNSVCGVVFQGSERATGCQFTFTCDGALARAPSQAIWARARTLAASALAGSVYAPVGWATHYHTNWVVPYWSSSLVKVANVGTHIFYRWEGGWGRPQAFRDGHAGAEPVLAKMSYLGFGAPPEQPQAELSVADQAALAAGEIPAEQLAEGAPLPAAVPASSYDPGALNRAIVRRFEPAKREGVAATLAKQTPPGTKIDDSLRWALTGDGVKAGDALGKKPAAPAADVKAGS